MPNHLTDRKSVECRGVRSSSPLPSRLSSAPSVSDGWYPSKPGLIVNRFGEIDALTYAEAVAIAEGLGWTTTNSWIEQGRYSPSLEMAFKIARAFNVPLDEVFQYPDGQGETS